MESYCTALKFGITEKIQCFIEFLCRLRLRAPFFDLFFDFFRWFIEWLAPVGLASEPTAAGRLSTISTYGCPVPFGLALILLAACFTLSSFCLRTLFVRPTGICWLDLTKPPAVTTF